MGHRPHEEFESLEIRDDIVRAAVSGDPDGFRAVYDALAPRVLGYLRSRGVEDPEGMVSEVFLAVHPRLADLTGGGAGLRTLVFSVAHARAVDDARRRSRRPTSFSYDPEYDDRVTSSAEQIAVVTGKTVASVKQLQRRGLVRLRSLMAATEVTR